MTTEQCKEEVLKQVDWTWIEEVEDDNPRARYGRRRKVEREVTGTVWRNGEEVGYTVTVDGDVRATEVHDTLYDEPGAIWTVAEQMDEMVKFVELYRWCEWQN